MAGSGWRREPPAAQRRDMRFNAVDFGSLGFASLAWAEGRGFGITATARYWPSSPSIPMGPGGRPGPLFPPKARAAAQSRLVICIEPCHSSMR